MHLFQGVCIIFKLIVLLSLQICLVQAETSFARAEAEVQKLRKDMKQQTREGEEATKAKQKAEGKEMIYQFGNEHEQYFQARNRADEEAERATQKSRSVKADKYRVQELQDEVLYPVDVCVLNDGAFSLSFHLKDVVSNQTSHETAAYPLSEKACLHASSLGSIRDGSRLVPVVTAVAGETVTPSDSITYSTNHAFGSVTEATYTCGGTTFDLSCTKPKVKNSKLKPPQLASLQSTSTAPQLVSLQSISIGVLVAGAFSLALGFAVALQRKMPIFPDASAGLLSISA
jgi:hypothetical protein